VFGFARNHCSACGGTSVRLAWNAHLASVEGQAANDLMDVIDDRAEVRSTIVASQLPVAEWHHLVSDPSIADALLDRLLHRAVRIELKGESLRERAPRPAPQLT